MNYDVTIVKIWKEVCILAQMSIIKGKRFLKKGPVLEIARSSMAAILTQITCKDRF